MKIRYEVIPNPPGRFRKGGYAIRDNSPHEIKGEDIEGIGWVDFSPPYPKSSSVICWFKRKRDALKHAELLNKQFPCQ